MVDFKIAILIAKFILVIRFGCECVRMIPKIEIEVFK